jgi:acetyl-CoA C-acetyltransferase
MKETEAVILSAVRTPIGRFQGALSGLTATRLGAIAVKAAVERAGIDPNDVEEVLMGNVVQAGEGQAPARQAAIFAGVPATVGATTVNKVCGSGLKAAMGAAQAVRAGDADLFIAGGFESMSRAPYLVSGRSGELKFGNTQLTDALLNDGLWDPFENWGMGMAAEFIGEEYEVTAKPWIIAQSHQRRAAQEAGKFRMKSFR